MEWVLRDLNCSQICSILRTFQGEYLDMFALVLEELEGHESAQERMRLAHDNAAFAAQEANARDAESGRPKMAASGELLPYRDFVQDMEYYSHSGKRYVTRAGCGREFDGRYDFFFPLDSSLAAEFFEAAGQHEKSSIQRRYWEAVMSWL